MNRFCNGDQQHKTIVYSPVYVPVLVVKSQISGVTAYGNTSSLLVSLDRISEQLLPQPPVPTPRNQIKPNGLFIPSPGFVDTNDERFLMMSQAKRLDGDFDLRKRASGEIIPQADQPMDSATALKSKQFRVTPELSKAEKRQVANKQEVSIPKKRYLNEHVGSF